MESHKELADIGCQLAEAHVRRRSFDAACQAEIDACVRMVGEVAKLLGGHRATKIIMDATEDIDPAAVEWLDRQWGDFI